MIRRADLDRETVNRSDFGVARVRRAFRDDIAGRVRVGQDQHATWPQQARAVASKTGGLKSFAAAGGRFDYNEASVGTERGGGGLFTHR